MCCAVVLVSLVVMLLHSVLIFVVLRCVDLGVLCCAGVGVAGVGLCRVVLAAMGV